MEPGRVRAELEAAAPVTEAMLTLALLLLAELTELRGVEETQGPPLQ